MSTTDPTIIRDADGLRALGRALRRDLETCGALEVSWKQRKSTRSINQNSRMWAMLTDVSRQVQWFVDGKMRLLKPEEWKHIFSAGLKKHQSVAAGIDGGFVILAQSTSKMTIGDMSDLMEIMSAFGSEPEHLVQWSDPKLADYAHTPEAARPYRAAMA